MRQDQSAETLPPRTPQEPTRNLGAHAMLGIPVAAMATLLEANGLSILLSAANAVIFAAGAYGRLPTEALTLWLTATLCLLFALRERSRAAHARLQGKDPRGALSHRSLRRLIMFSVLMALPWAALAILFLGASDRIVDVLILMVCGGMCAGGATLQHRVPVSAVTFFATILISVVVGCFLRGIEEFWPVAAYTLPFGVALFMMTATTSRIAEEREANLDSAAKALDDLQVAVSDLNRLRTSAERESLTDDLTQLHNRRSLEREISRRKDIRTAGGPGIAILHIDLDRFKQINDALGHAAGDFVLRHVAQTLKRMTRSNDFIARIGGDEFIAVIDYKGEKQTMQALAGRIITELNKPVFFEGQLCYFGASIGIATCGDHSDAFSLEFSQVLTNADIALYSAKTAGRNRYQIYCKELRDEAERAKFLGDDLIAAIKRREIEPAYQVQMHANGADIFGVETLARWRHPKHGMVPPFEFLPIADRLGVTKIIDEIILEKALADLKEWDDQGFCVPRLSVNISHNRLADPRLIDHLKSLDLPRGRLSFEVLESVFSDHVNEEMRRNLDWLEAHDVDIELDDFGTGHTSLLALLNLGPQRIKIARELVQPIIESKQHADVVQAIVDIARSLKIEVIAEGVETEEHARAVAAAGCTVLQGYHFSRPIFADAFVAAYHADPGKAALTSAG